MCYHHSPSLGSRSHSSHRELLTSVCSLGPTGKARPSVCTAPRQPQGASTLPQSPEKCLLTPVTCQPRSALCVTLCGLLAVPPGGWPARLPLAFIPGLCTGVGLPTVSLLFSQDAALGLSDGRPLQSLEATLVGPGMGAHWDKQSCPAPTYLS